MPAKASCGANYMREHNTLQGNHCKPALNMHVRTFLNW